MVKAKQKYNLFTGKALLWLIVPIVIESALSSSLGIIDGLMASNAKSGAGDNVLTAITAVDQISNLITQLFVAFGVGGAVITSQFLGAKKIDEANKSAKQLVVVMLLAALVITTISLVLNRQIVTLIFGEAGEETLGLACTYFYIIAASFPFRAVFNANAALLRAQRKSMNTMLSGIISFLLNIPFNALFIYGFNMGIAGVALGTLIALIFPAVFTTFLLTRKNNIVRIKIFERFRFDGKQLKKILKLAVPSGIENSLFQLGKILVISFITIGIYQVDGLNIHAAANSVANNINSVGSTVGSGINTAILTVIGQAVGTGDTGQVKYYIKKMLAISYICNTACVAFVFAMSPLLLNFYNISGGARSVAWQCLIVCFCFQCVTYPLAFGLPAVLKATSDVRYVMVCSVASMMIMRVGLCYILTCDWAGVHLGAMGLWIGMVADWIVRAILFFTRLMSGRWKKASGMLIDGVPLPPLAAVQRLRKLRIHRKQKYACHKEKE